LPTIGSDAYFIDIYCLYCLSYAYDLRETRTRHHMDQASATPAGVSGMIATREQSLLYKACIVTSRRSVLAYKESHALQ